MVLGIALDTFSGIIIFFFLPALLCFVLKIYWLLFEEVAIHSIATSPNLFASQKNHKP